jgi:hypothetical protein
VEVPLLLQFSIALFTGMVAATFVPPVRRVIPRALEVGLWVGLFFVCGLGVVSVTDPSARELTSAALWGVDQVINTMVSLAIGGAIGFVADNRVAIATWLAVIAGVDLLVLALIRSMRAAQGWKPRVRLGEWMEMPLQAKFAAEPAVPTDGLADLNRRLAASGAVAGAQVLRWLVECAIWARDVVLPREAQRLAHAAEVGRVQSRAGLESLRDATLHLQFAARAWYSAAGAPVLNDFGMKATEAVRLAAAAGKRGAESARLAPDQVIDIQALLSAQSIGWYGPLSAGPSLPPLHDEQDGAEQRSDRLAS